MKNYRVVGCKELVSSLKKEMEQLFLEVEKDASQENIDSYFNKRNEYLFAKRELDSIKEN